ncbi:MAG TPA: alpha/beta hydrolase [Candidatus Acidoferrum sp.]|nr:alpha/beta hydrolase [Candidatus Acidoferrum sp.]
MKSAWAASKAFEFVSSDGLRIACSRWDAHVPARGVVQIAHGLGEHIGRHAEVIEVLLQAGLAVYGNDHRGHGRTALPHNSFGDFGPGGFDLLVEDMVKLTDIVEAENPSKPLILLGHSMGSFAAQQYVLDHSALIDGLVLSGTGALDGLSRVASKSAEKYSFLNAGFAPARTPYDWLSRDPKVADGFMKDPLCFGTLVPASTASLFAAASQLADATRLAAIRHDLPVYLFSGSEDPVGEQLAGVRTVIDRYRHAGISNISFDLYDGGRHEMLNEVNRAEVRARLLAWITAALQY